jgi:hypothetical protein
MSIVVFLVLSAVLFGLLFLLVRRAKNSRWRNASVTLAGIGTLPTLLMLAVLSAPIANNLRLARFSAQLFRYPLPPNSREVARKAEVGVTGNGDHCDFVASRTVESRLPLAAVRAHYAQLQLKRAIGGGTGDSQLTIDVERTTTGLYVVSAVDYGYYGIFDWRCF